ncbi:protein WHAT'S THIS FACTOR 9, mitochondrial [Medicago truncatula]|uniref:protein WHAT'S THIS FACTOR 9, mitochondrial n=1 Tax=Medicago truncatula TaxID=3880 RepID=UPI000D2F306E|nr:protein WHAT'S THIS FACTOR 9, mitochondrial [Medicago truncatula]
MMMNKFKTAMLPFQNLQLQFQSRGIAKVRLKWVKNRSIDHIIDKETDLKAASLLKDAIKRSSTSFLTAKTFSDWQKLLGLTVPVLRFIRRYPTLFHEFPHPRWNSLPCFRLTDTAQLLDSQEQSIYAVHENDIVERFSKFVKAGNGVSAIRLVDWCDEFAVSALQKSNQCESENASDQYRDFKRGKTALVFPMRFPRGYGGQKKVRFWMDEFQKLPYISPYADSSKIDPKSDLMEKRVVGVLHEFLSLCLHKKTKRNYLRSLREELNLPHKFTRIFTRYPGIFYLSLKCKTTTVTLREGYARGKLVDPHPLARHRDKFYHVMRTGLLYRGDGSLKLGEDASLMLDSVENDEMGDGDSEEEVETSDEFCEGDVSDSDDSE